MCQWSKQPHNTLFTTTMSKKPPVNAFQPIVVDPTSMMYNQRQNHQANDNAHNDSAGVEYVSSHKSTNLYGMLNNPVLSSLSADLTHSHGHALTHLPSTIRIDASNNAQMMNGKSATLIEGGEMTLSVSLEGLRGMVRGVVKTRLFPKVKFLTKEKHGTYAHRPQTVCGLVMKHCNISAVDTTSEWWDELRPSIFRTHTDHRNNCIKAIRLRYRGTCANHSAIVGYISFLYLLVSSVCCQKLYRVSSI